MRSRLGLAGDAAVWAFAKTHGFVIVSKDSDFADLSILYGAPPKIVWIRRGNCSTSTIAALLRAHASMLAAMEKGAVDRLLVSE